MMRRCIAVLIVAGAIVCRTAALPFVALFAPDTL
jgi:hypothetical protein